MQSFGDSIVSLARALGITRQTCSKKIETVEGWTNIEIAKIAHRYNLNDDEIITIFDLRRFSFNPEIDDKKLMECIVSDANISQRNIKVTNQIQSLEQSGAKIIKTRLCGDDLVITYEI